MKDRLNRPLAVGDKVAYVFPGTRELELAEVLRVTPKGATLGFYDQVTGKCNVIGFRYSIQMVKYE